MKDGQLVQLAGLLRARNTLDAQLATLIGRPPEKGHLGEYIASRIFGIELHESAAHRGTDGHFLAGPLEGHTVNVKYYGKQDGLIAIAPKSHPNYYLVLTGPKGAAGPSKGLTRPFVIASAYLFAHEALVAGVTAKIDPLATSVRAALWQAAEIYPTPTNPLLPLSGEQRALLALFTGQG